jgi:hypothetical protein
MYEFLFESCILRFLNYVWEKHFLTILQSEFILYFSCHVKNVFLTTLISAPTELSSETAPCIHKFQYYRVIK